MAKSKGRPKTLMKLPPFEERKEFLEICDRLALVLKARAVLDRRVHVNQNKRDVKRAESDLAHFERLLSGVLADLKKAAEKTKDLDRYFGQYLRNIKEKNKSTDEIFGIANVSIGIVDDLYESSNTWLAAWASTSLCNYFEGNMWMYGYEVNEDADKEGAIEYLSRFAGKDKAELEKALDIQIEKTKNIKASTERADRIVGTIAGCSADRVKRYRLEEKNRPRWTDDFDVLNAIHVPKNKGKK